jgi:hypothetical protein
LYSDECLNIGPEDLGLDGLAIVEKFKNAVGTQSVNNPDGSRSYFKDVAWSWRENPYLITQNSWILGAGLGFKMEGNPHVQVFLRVNEDDQGIIYSLTSQDTYQVKISLIIGKSLAGEKVPPVVLRAEESFVNLSELDHTWDRSLLRNVYGEGGGRVISPVDSFPKATPSFQAAAILGLFNDAVS